MEDMLIIISFFFFFDSKVIFFDFLCSPHLIFCLCSPSASKTPHSWHLEGVVSPVERNSGSKRAISVIAHSRAEP